VVALVVNSRSSSYPLVSVIIASYNHGPYIEASIRSVMAQTYAHIELLVIDDGSTDDSVATITRLQKELGFDFRVQANQGLSITLNEAIARCQGALIAPFGSDDVMLPARLSLQVDYMHDKPEVGICAGSVQEIDAQGQPLGRDKPPYWRRLDFEDVFLNRKPGSPAPTLLFRREALESVGGFDPEVRLEDLMIELKITRAGYFIDVLGEVLALYRVHGSNTYKNYPFMVDNVLRTFARFSDHPAYEQVCANYRNSMFLKCARQDKALARRLLSELPMKAWDRKTLRGLWRLLLPAQARERA
tara:strand:+ start:10876 stop:11781 length:906 start_codon:yes stop_codon:yes gene_type:complete